MPWRASNRSAAGAAHEGFGDELLRQAFKYVYDYARNERNLSLVGGHTSELNFNSSNLSLAQYWAELPTSMVSLAELQEQSRVLDNTVRRMFADKFHHEKGYWHDQKATQRAIEQEPHYAVDLNHTAFRELSRSALWRARFEEQLEALPAHMKLVNLTKRGEREAPANPSP